MGLISRNLHRYHNENYKFHHEILKQKIPKPQLQQQTTTKLEKTTAWLKLEYIYSPPKIVKIENFSQQEGWLIWEEEEEEDPIIFLSNQDQEMEHHQPAQEQEDFEDDSLEDWMKGGTLSWRRMEDG